MNITVLAPAKLNLFLDITGKRSDNYHIINTVMQAVSLYDEVTVSNHADQISVWCSDDEIPVDETNTAYKAVLAFAEYTHIDCSHTAVKIKKNIPSRAGMAGGSTDAAAVLAALNRLYKTHLTPEQLADIAEPIGADVPFCVYGGTMTASGIGTILTPIPDMPKCYIVIVKPTLKISTKEAYEKSDKLGYDECRNADVVVDGICNGSIVDVARGLYNKFEEVIDNAEIRQIKVQMKENGALGACMTGSGSAVFGIFEDKGTADDCADGFRSHYDHVYVVEPISDGQTLK